MTLKTILLSSAVSLVLAYLGSSANRFVMKANGGQMPALDRSVPGWIPVPLVHALRKGAVERQEKGVYIPIGPDTKYRWMADVINIGIGCASFGDMLIFAACAVIGSAIWGTMSEIVSGLAKVVSQ